MKDVLKRCLAGLWLVAALGGCHHGSGTDGPGPVVTEPTFPQPPSEPGAMGASDAHRCRTSTSAHTPRSRAALYSRGIPDATDHCSRAWS